jgi:hypothetical protein
MPSATTRHSTQTDLLAAQLEHSDSATIYVDIDGMTQADADTLLLAEPPLHAEFDLVRQKWAVRLASPDEAAEAHAAASDEDLAPKAGKSTASTST